MIIKSLKNIPFDQIYNAFSRAFADYEMQLNKEQLQGMLKRRGFVPELSFGAFEKKQLVAFTLNGIGIFNGKQTAYDTGTGTIKEYRGQGLATQIFEYSVPFLKNERIEQYLLEVLQHNSKAVSIYKNVGFKVSREFNYFIQDTDALNFKDHQNETPYKTTDINLNDIESAAELADFHPSWQNSFDAINRAPEDFIIKAVYQAKKIIGYCIIEPKTGDITQIAVDKKHRRKGIGTFLLSEAIKHNKNTVIKIINTDKNCLAITDFLKSKNVLIKGKQYEMIKDI